MSTVAKTYVTPEQYLAQERRAEFKSEYFAGEVFAMPGASRRHNLVTLNCASEMRDQLKDRPCEVYASDMRVKVNATGLYTYPDVAAACGEIEFEDADVDTLLNPGVLVEVLSKSTEDYDRGGKFAHYRKIGSLQEYVLISQDRPHVEHHVRQSDNQWLLTEYDGIEQRIQLAAIHCELPLVEIYRNVSWPSPSSSQGEATRPI